MFVGSNGYVFELNPVGGQVVQSLLLTSAVGVGDYTTELATDGASLFAGVHGYAYAVALSDWSKSAWSTGLGGIGAFVPVAVLATGGRLFAASNGYLYELNPATGAILNSQLLTSRFSTGDFRTSLATDGANLYAGVYGYVYKISLSGWNAPSWSTGVGGTLAVHVIWTGTQLFACSNGYVYALDPNGGNVLQHLQLSDSIGVGDYTTRVASAGGMLFAGVHGYAYGVSLSNWNAPAWTVAVGVSSVQTYQPAHVLAFGGRAFVGSNGYAYRIDPGSGAVEGSLLLSSIVGVGDYDTRLATDGFNLFAGAHGYSYRVLSLYAAGLGPIGLSGCAANPDGSLQIVALDAAGVLWHTIRAASGTWPYPWGNVLAATSAPFASADVIAPATFANGVLNLLAIDPGGTLWHVQRFANGTWTPWGDVAQAVPGPPIGALNYAAAATDPAGDLHVLVLDAQNTLWHTIRNPDGSWPYPWGNVQAVMSGTGLATIGPPSLVTAACDPNGDLQIVVMDETNRLWHTRRVANGSWPYAWDDVASEVTGPRIDPLRTAAVATDGAGNLTLLAIDTTGTLYHTIRQADGSWPFPWGNVNQAIAGESLLPLDRAAGVSATIDPSGNLDVLNVDEPAGLWCTARRPSGTWSGWTDVQGALAGAS